jgi:imidazolonepropionase-like amidohydrolase/outer membrane lipoprotein-sorting protein
MFIKLRRLCLVLLLASISALGQNESGKFILHKFEQAIGQETYTLNQDGGQVALESDFTFTDRGSTVPLKASFKGAKDYTPQSFVIKGKTSRLSDIDVDVSIDGSKAVIRNGKASNTVAVPKQFFTIAGYSPVAQEMLLMRYWRSHGSPAKLATLPSGQVEIRDRGVEKVEVGGRTVELRRYSLKGVAWGLETLWMDSENNLVALVTRDAEFDHFEAVRDGFEPELAMFVTNAARDQMAELEELSKELPGRKSGVLALTGATVIDGTAKPPIANATVITQGGKILAVGPATTVKIPDGATRIDVKGKYIIPGLWDMHAHYEQVEWGPIYLAAGVTTVRDVGNEFEFITAVRDKVNSGQGLGPQMLLAGIVDGASKFTVGITQVNSPEDAANWVKKYHDAGFQQMKLYSSMKPENVVAVSKEAHAMGMTVTGHIPNGMTIFDGVNDGMDQVNHITYLSDVLLPKTFDRAKATRLERFKASAAIDVHSPEGEHLVSFLKEHGTVIDPTVGIYEAMLRSADEPATNIEPGIANVAPELREQLINGGLSAEAAPYGKATVEKLLEIIGALHKAGVAVVVGTDQGVPGYSVYREMELYVKAGFTPLEALQAATIVPARVMKLDKETGTLEPGKRADFAIAEKNPLENISNVRTVRSVVANGVYYDSAPLWQSAGFKAPGGAQQASASPLEEVLNKMDEAAAGFQTVETDFVWDQYQRVVDETDSQRGVMYFRRNGKSTEMAANVTSPDTKSILFSEGTVQMYQPKIDQVTKYSAGKDKADFESFLVLGFGGRGHDLAKSFDVKYAGTESVGGVNTAKLELTPKAAKVKGMFSKITLWIDPARGVSVQQRFTEPTGDYRLAKYSNIKMNGKLSGDVFKLKTTAKTKVVVPNG